ncbi:MAG: DUF4157 domain-containing protein [Bacteroidetes bacterium]|nr:DUF4157 domain-containing protein [Bacteroidota bacterium]
MKAGSGGGGSESSGPSGIPDEVMGKMESTFNTDFSNVNIVQNSSKASEAGALAYAQGNDVHFAPGQFSPETPGGQQLLGHELSHVVQQRQGRVQANSAVNGMAVNNDHALEAEADAMGAKAAQMKVDASPAAKTPSTAAAPVSAPTQLKADPNAKTEGKSAKEKMKRKMALARLSTMIPHSPWTDLPTMRIKTKSKQAKKMPRASAKCSPSMRPIKAEPKKTSKNLPSCPQM